MEESPEAFGGDASGVKDWKILDVPHPWPMSVAAQYKVGFRPYEGTQCVSRINDRDRIRTSVRNLNQVVMHDYDSGLSFVSSESVLQPDNLAMAYLTFISLWPSRADHNQHSIVNLGYSTKSESLLENQVTSRPVIVVSTCGEDVLAA